MALNLNVNNFANLNIAKENNAGASTLNIGNFMGNELVQVPTPMSLIADAAEELTFSVDNTDELDLKERQDEKKTKERPSFLIEKIKQFQEIKDFRQHRIFLALKNKLANTPSAEQAIKDVREHFSEPSDAWAFLQEVLKDFKAEVNSNSQTIVRLEQAIKILEDTETASIYAGVSGTITASSYENAEALGGASELGTFYRKVVCDFTDLSKMFEYINESYADSSFETAVAFLTKALGDDLGTDTPSMGTRHLELVANNLGQLKMLQSANALCVNLINRWENIHAIKDHELKPMQMLNDIIKLRGENFVNQNSISPLVALAKAPNIEAEVLFVQELLNTARSFSTQLFNGIEDRAKVINAIQETLDSAIDKEDEFLANQ